MYTLNSVSPIDWAAEQRTAKLEEEKRIRIERLNAMTQHLEECYERADPSSCYRVCFNCSFGDMMSQKVSDKGDESMQEEKEQRHVSAHSVGPFFFLIASSLIVLGNGKPCQTVRILPSWLEK